MQEMFIFETLQLAEQLEQRILSSENANSNTASIDEIFRIMHTIKGSAAMMMFDQIASLAHALEDLYDMLRTEQTIEVDSRILTDLTLDAVDFIKQEIDKIQQGKKADGDSSPQMQKVQIYISSLDRNLQHKGMEAATITKTSQQQPFYVSSCQNSGTVKSRAFIAHLFFEDGCEMENIRAFTVVHNLQELCQELLFSPEDILENTDSVKILREQGFHIVFRTRESVEEVNQFFAQIPFSEKVSVQEVGEREYHAEPLVQAKSSQVHIQEEVKNNDPLLISMGKQGVGSQLMTVSVEKLDSLMDLVGELVISEAMVSQNGDIKGLKLHNFQKAARQHKKLISDLQDLAMSIRMVPLEGTFQKMNRLIRDVSRKLEKEISLKIIGEDTEVDKNIIEKISDPLMHLIRNGVDHGIELPQERMAQNKTKQGTITLEAKHAGGEVWIIVRDDGRGLNKSRIVEKAQRAGLTTKQEHELSEGEIHSFIFAPGFSTKESVSELSGRGVGMDVVMQNIQKVGGSITVESKEHIGSIFTIKVPLTLAIIDGMTVKVGQSAYSIPITSIRESFRPREQETICDPSGREMILIRGNCYPIIRLHELYKIQTDIYEFHKGILIMVEHDGKSICLLADALLGEQQVVVKPLPRYIKKVQGIAGCALLGDGKISLILDISSLV